MRRTKYRIQKTRSRLRKVLEDPQARLVENKYKAIRRVLIELHPQLYGRITPGEMLALVEDAIALDRDWRLETEGEQKALKEKLSQQKQVELGYSPTHHQDVKKLKTLR